MIGLLLDACGLAPYHAMDSARAESKSFRNNGSLQALHLVKVQDLFNCILV
jgi:hypothetical protein